MYALINYQNTDPDFVRVDNTPNSVNKGSLVIGDKSDEGSSFVAKQQQ